MAQAQQPKNLEEALQVIQQQNELINQLKVALQLQQHRQFAKKNESLNPDQLSLFEEKQVGVTDSEEPSDAAVEKRESSRHPKPKKNNSRKENLDRLPQEDYEYDLDDKTCPDCHQEMKQIGRRLASREAVYVPAHTVCRNVYAKTYKC
nr:IS66 family transposase zinc-finger binding domain-containing protein [Limosilactobacillus mucosae]